MALLMLRVFDMNTQVSNRRLQGMTLLEALVVMVILAVLAATLLPYFARARSRSPRISCISNMKQIGTAYRIWENDNGDTYPMQQTEALGGCSNLLASGVGEGQYAYLTYTIMQNEMGQSPKIVVCPSDERTANTNFWPGTGNMPSPSTSFNLGGAGTFDNTNVSYWVGVGAIDTYPQSLLGGDRNLGDGGVINAASGVANNPAQDPNYGISGTTTNPEHPCGADAIMNTNGAWSFAVISGGGGSIDRGTAVGWSAKIHSAGNTAGAGNIMLGDGSAQQVSSANFRQSWLRNAADLGNFAGKDKIHASVKGDVRLLFP
jgi:prepilin-type N-terminal cleavage/methylation domain-containing protein